MGRRLLAAPGRRRDAGVAAVEFALMLPILVLMLVAVTDIARAIQANMILINLSREAANLSARGAMQLSTNSQSIIGAVAASAPPLDMNDLGMLYVTELMGYKDPSSGIVRTVVLGQYRWDDSVNNRGFRVSGYAPTSTIWTCPSWSSTTGGCLNIATGALAPSVSLMSGSLYDGQIVYVAEAFYKFNMLFTSFSVGTFVMPKIGPNLYSKTIF